MSKKKVILYVYICAKSLNFFINYLTEKFKYSNYSWRQN